MRVEPFRAQHLAELVLQPHQRVWQDSLTDEQGRAVEALGSAWTLFTDRLVGCGGVIDRGGGRGEAWALIAQDAGRDMLAATRAVRRYFETAPFRRIEAVTAANFAPAGRWAEMLGFVNEGLMAAFCADGSPAYRWAMIRWENCDAASIAAEE